MKNLYLSEFPTKIRTKEIVSKKQAEELRKWNEFRLFEQMREIFQN